MWCWERVGDKAPISGPMSIVPSHRRHLPGIRRHQKRGPSTKNIFYKSFHCKDWWCQVFLIVNSRLGEGTKLTKAALHACYWVALSEASIHLDLLITCNVSLVFGSLEAVYIPRLVAIRMYSGREFLTRAVVACQALPHSSLPQMETGCVPRHLRMRVAEPSIRILAGCECRPRSCMWHLWEHRIWCRPEVDCSLMHIAPGSSKALAYADPLLMSLNVDDWAILGNVVA